jgi:hypothetical protein
MIGWAAIGAAFAGYGDAIDSRPSHAEREVHLWTNAVRTDPEAFRTDYACSYSSFSSDEQTPKWPLRMHEGLVEAARYHADDMRDLGYFSHDSADGTPWNVRIARYYPSSYVGENIAWGYGTPWSAVIEGWMCSTSGHRANIMSASWDELGTGVSGSYYVQDFGYRGVGTRAIAMGLHVPENPGSGEVTFHADHAGTGAPTRFEVVLDGTAIGLALAFGTPTSGVYSATADPGSGCHTYYFEVEDASGTTRFPEDGSYGWGSCAWDDPDAKWIAEQVEPEPPDTGGDDTGDTDVGGGNDDPLDTDERPPLPSDEGGGVGLVGGCASVPVGGPWSGASAGAILSFGLTLRRTSRNAGPSRIS